MTYRYTRHNLRTNSLSYEELAHDLRNLAHFSRTEQLRQRIFLSENRYQHLIHFFSVDLRDTLEQGDLMIINQSTINMFSDPLTLINSLWSYSFLFNINLDVLVLGYGTNNMLNGIPFDRVNVNSILPLFYVQSNNITLADVELSNRIDIMNAVHRAVQSLPINQRLSRTELQYLINYLLNFTRMSIDDYGI